MYQAKAVDGDSYRHFKPEMQDVVVKALALRADLKAAIAAQELTLAYQPIIDLRTGETSGCEALLRWEHAVRGTVSPATFIPVAEESGLIVALGRWVLERACEDAVSFQRAGPARPAILGLGQHLGAATAPHGDRRGGARGACARVALTPAASCSKSPRAC